MRLDKQAIARRQIAAMDAMDINRLRSRFMELYGIDTQSYNEQNLRYRIAYRIQELQFGGLAEDTERLLDCLAKKDPLANLEAVKARSYTLTCGTRFVREWHGQRYEVKVSGPRQFEYEGRMYRSLTAIATEITGTHQNGRAFFGVTK